MLMTLAAVVILILASGYKDTLLRWLLPGDSAVTAAALGELAENVQEGVPAGEAITAFCREILNNATG